jgi:Big-like domain-containing protein/malectin (di-glucose binding ER protein)
MDRSLRKCRWTVVLLASALGALALNSVASAQTRAGVDDVVAPQVTAVTPVDGSADVSYNVRPTISFSRAIDSTTLNASTVVLRRQDGSQAAAAVLYSSATLTATLVPLAPLDLSKTYTVVVTTAVKALGDETPLDSQVSFSFTTTATADPVRVDDGGAGDGAFASDRFYKGGAAIATAAPIANTTDPLLYQTQRVGTWANGIWSYTIPVPNGTYDLKLYFAEIQKWGPGQRRFNLDVIGTPANPDISNLDIFAAAGGANRAYSVTIPNVATCGAGAIRINATALVDYPAIAGFEAIPAAASACSTSPAAGASGVSRNASVTATFSRQLDASSITPASFTLTSRGGALVPATVSYDPATNRATLTPSDPLAPYTTYRAAVSGTGSDGTPSTGAAWSFTTGA